MNSRPLLTNVLVSQRRKLADTGVLSLRNLNIDDFSFIGVQKSMKSLDLTGCNFSALYTLLPQPNLKEIIADDSRISSLAGLSAQTRLMRFSYVNTPFYLTENNRVACLACSTPRLSVINGKPVSQRERELASSFPKVVRYLIESGWTLQLPLPSTADLRYLVSVFQLNVPSKDFVSEKPLPLVDSVSTTTECADTSFSSRLANLLRPMGFGIRSGPEMNKDIVSAISTMCDTVLALENCSDRASEDSFDEV